MDFLIDSQRNILNELSNINVVDKKMYDVIGESGSGKTHVAKCLKTKLLSKYEIVYLEYNDTLDSGVNSIFIDYINKNSKIDEIKTVAGASIQDIPYLGNTLASIKNVVVKDDTENIEKFIIKHFRKKYCNKRVVFICDNLDLWSTRDLNILFTLFFDSSLEKINLITFYKNFEYFFNLKEVKMNKSFSINLKDNDVISIINKIIVPNISLDNEHIEIIRLLSKNNINIILELAYSLNDHIKDSTSQFSLNNLNNIFNIEHYFDKRIKDEVTNTEDFKTLLKKASLLGAKQNSDVLKFFVKYDILEYTNYIIKASELKILLKKERYLYFSNNQLHKFLLNSINENEKVYFMQLEECIKTFYPTNYNARIKALVSANETNKVNELLVIKQLEDIRNYGDLDQTNIYMFDKYKYLYSSYSLYIKGKYTDALAEIKRIDKYDSLLLNFEIDYLRALIVTNQTIELEELGEIKRVILSWATDNKFKKNEPEMWLRSIKLLIELAFELADKNFLEQQLTSYEQYCRHIVNTDKKVEKMQMNFYSKANCYCKIESAYLATKEAHIYFKKNRNKLDFIINYYLSSLNHMGNCIVLNYLDEAIEIIKEISILVNTNNDLTFQRLDIYYNNILLVLYLKNSLSLSEYSIKLENLSGKSTDIGDNILIKNNLLATYILLKDFKKSNDLATELINHIDTISTPDDYYVYYVYNNYIMLLVALKRFDEARAYLSLLSNLQPLLYDKRYFNKRNQILLKLNDAELFKVVNKEILPSKDIGDAWCFWGRTLMFSELQIWTD